MMTPETLFLQIWDPSGQVRQLKLSEFPQTLGTRLDQKLAFRDPKISESALRLEKYDHGFVLKSLQDGLNINLGDLKLLSLELPLNVTLKIGDTEIRFAQAKTKEESLEFPQGVQAWHTETEAGRSLIRSLRKASESRLSIYLSGETGTGKEVLAKLTHLWSERASGPFVAINCGALAVSLAESELFGHVKGAFTGAVRDRAGALLQAHGGTLFLDEVGDLPPELQVKLLRFFEDGEIRPVGSDRVMHAEVRVVCATHKPLLKLVQEGKFRQDLYYRLATIPIEIPSLRSRPEDIEALAVRFAQEHSKKLTPEALLRLRSCAWAGNVRELRHSVERACGLVGKDAAVVHASDFDFLTQQMQIDLHSEAARISGVLSLKEMERIMILRALKAVNGNRADASKILGIARSTLFEMMKRHQIIGPKSNQYWMSELSHV